MNKKRIIIGSLVLGVIVITCSIYGIYKVNYNNHQKTLVLSKDLGLTQQEKQMFVDKINDLKDQISKRPSDNDFVYKANVDIASNYMGMGEYKTSLEWLNKAVNIFPDKPLAYGQTGEVQRLMKDYDKATENFRKALALTPENANLWAALIDTYKVSNTYTAQGMKDLYEEALSKTNSSINIVTLYAQFLQTNNDLPGAVKYWKIAIEKNPQDSALYQAEIDKIQSSVK